MPKQKNTDDLLFERGLPADLWTEQCALGACIRHDTDGFSKFGVLLSALSESDFSRESHRRIFSAMRSIHERGQEIDYTATMSQLSDAKNVEAIGGRDYVDEIDRISWGTEYQPRRYFEGIAKQLRRKSLARDLLRLFDHGMKRCANNENPQEILPDFMDRLRELSNQYGDADSNTADKIIESAGGLQAFLCGGSGDEARTWTPWHELNRMTLGLRPGRLWILAALTSCGKTTMALQLLSKAVQGGKSGIYFTLEMPVVDLLRSLTSAMATVDSQHIEHGRYTPGEYDRVQEAARLITSWPILWEEFNATDPLRIRSKVETAMARGQVGVVVVDYLQLVGGGSRRFDNKNAEVSYISRALKLMSGEFGIPFVVLSQLNREPARNSRAPQLSDLRESGSIEQDADVVMFLHRPDREDRERTEAIISKNRLGPCGSFNLSFELPYRRFKED